MRDVNMYIVMYIIYICMYVYPNHMQLPSPNASTLTWHPALNEKLPQSHQAIEETVTRTASNSHLGALRLVWR